MKSELGILNVGAGDTKLSFDKSNPAECARAAKIVEDMLKRGYAILVQVGEKDGEPIYQRAKAFDPETCEYIISAGPDEAIAVGDILRGEAERPAGFPGDPSMDKSPSHTAKRGRGRPRTRDVRIEASGTRAVSVSRSAGG